MILNKHTMLSQFVPVICMNIATTPTSTKLFFLVMNRYTHQHMLHIDIDRILEIFYRYTLKTYRHGTSFHIDFIGGTSWPKVAPMSWPSWWAASSPWRSLQPQGPTFSTVFGWKICEFPMEIQLFPMDILISPRRFSPVFSMSDLFFNCFLGIFEQEFCRIVL